MVTFCSNFSARVLSGAASAHLHVLNPDSRSNFKRALLMSGNAFNYFTFVNGGLLGRDIQMDILYRTYKDDLGNQTIEKFMKDAPVNVLVKRTPSWIPALCQLSPYWSAVLEGLHIFFMCMNFIIHFYFYFHEINR